MNADFVAVARFAGVGVGFLGLLALALYLTYRVAAGVRAAAPRGERRLGRGVLAFLAMHGLTLTTGGFAFALVIVGLSPELPADERAGFVRAMAACFAVGPALALAAWAGLRCVHRTGSGRCA